MQLKDYSDLKDQAAQRVEIPLNGEVYYAEPEPPAQVILAASGMSSNVAALVEEMAKAGIDPNDPDAMRRMAEEKPLLGARMAASSGSATQRALVFFQEVLEPESARRWADNMRAKPPTPPAPEGVNAEQWAESWQPTAEAMAEHRRRRITIKQVMAVFQALVAAYSARPTVPSSSSQNGRGGTGGTSTAGAPATGV